MDTNCNTAIYSVETSLEILVGKWKSIILMTLIKEETLRFSELQRAIPSITKKMLTSQLRELEANKIINRKIYPQIPPKVEYSITEYGKTLVPLLLEMYKWGAKHSEIMGKEQDDFKVVK